MARFRMLTLTTSNNLEREIDETAAREGGAERLMRRGFGVTQGRPQRKRRSTSISCPNHRKQLGGLVAVPA